MYFEALEGTYGACSVRAYRDARSSIASELFDRNRIGCLKRIPLFPSLRNANCVSSVCRYLYEGYNLTLCDSPCHTSSGDSRRDRCDALACGVPEWVAGGVPPLGFFKSRLETEWNERLLSLSRVRLEERVLETSGGTRVLSRESAFVKTLETFHRTGFWTQVADGGHACSASDSASTQFYRDTVQRCFCRRYMNERESEPWSWQRLVMRGRTVREWD